MRQRRQTGTGSVRFLIEICPHNNQLHKVPLILPLHPMMQNKKPLFRTVLCRKAALCFFFLPLQAEACGPAPLFKSEPSIIRRKRIILPCARHAAGHESAALLSVHAGFFCCAKGLSFSPFCFSGHIFIQKRGHFHVICYFLYCNMNQAGVQ